MELTDLPTYQIAVLQSRSNRALKTKMAQFLRNYDITPMQWSIIGLVSDAGKAGVRISDLASELDTSMAFITTTVNMLEAKHIVHKTGHERDSRAKLVRLNEEFQAKITTIEADLHASLAAWLQEKMPIAKLGVYFDALSIIAKA